MRYWERISKLKDELLGNKLENIFNDEDNCCVLFSIANDKLLAIWLRAVKMQPC